MNKPKWSEVPKNAKFLAQDRDGDWYWWTNEPKIMSGISYWMPSGWRDCSLLAASAPIGMIVGDWQGSLESRNDGH